MTPPDRKQRSKKPAGRREGDSGTRAAILAAARELFAANGYQATAVRAIAAKANVDPALIRHFYGNKEALFSVCVAGTLPRLMAEAFDGDPAKLGERIADRYLRLWEDPETQPVLLALVRSAATSERAAEMLLEALRTTLPPNVVSSAEGVAKERLGLAAAHLLGVGFARYVLKSPLIVGLDHDALVALLGPTIQQYLEGMEARQNDLA